MPPSCTFAESLILPRISRTEADVAEVRGDLDAAHKHARAIDVQVTALSIAQVEDRRRLDRLESMVSDQATESARVRIDISEIKSRVDAVFERLHDISIGVSGLRQAVDAQGTTATQRHEARTRRALTTWGLVATGVVLLAAIHQSFTGVSVLDALKMLMGFAQ
jgi:uncharacterized protein YoxC